MEQDVEVMGIRELMTEDRGSSERETDHEVG